MEQMNVVIVGHVDHGKSTVIGRLLADTNSLPEGKLEQVKKTCAINAKPFEYAFLLDALKDEQEQGITIDMARCFFKTRKRHYIIIDAPGHIEFLKNMITGAAHAESALLVIDAHEGVQENSRRHGYMLSLLGIKQVIVLVNKMDLVGYKESVFNDVKEEYEAFLKDINVTPQAFIPISAREGDHIIKQSPCMPWYTGASVLAHIDGFKKEELGQNKDLRFPVQDIYKFTENKDDRRIVAGRIETGTISVGDSVVFYPSRKESVIKAIEGFNMPSQTSVSAGYSTGVTLTTQVYVKSGELMCIKGQKEPLLGSQFKARLFWLGKTPFVLNKKYQLKIGAKRSSVYLKAIISVLDASNLSFSTQRKSVERHEVAECVFQTTHPIAFDRASDFESTGRFVIIDEYEIAGGGIIVEKVEDTDNLTTHYIHQRDAEWQPSYIEHKKRAKKIGHQAGMVLITADRDVDRVSIAKALEETLFSKGFQVYSLGLPNMMTTFDKEGRTESDKREKQIFRMGEIGHAFTDAGSIFISTIPELDDYEAETIEQLIAPAPLYVINIGPLVLHRFPTTCHLAEGSVVDVAVQAIVRML